MLFPKINIFKYKYIFQILDEEEEKEEREIGDEEEEEREMGGKKYWSCHDDLFVFSRRAPRDGALEMSIISGNLAIFSSF